VKAARHPRHRVRTAVMAALVLAVLFVAIESCSYTSAPTAGNNTNPALWFVEWLRDHHMGFVVAVSEDVFYTIDHPPEGGPALRHLPSRPKASPRLPGSAPVPGQGAISGPKNVQPVVHPALPQEGVWTPSGQTVGGRYPILTTTLRPDPLHPSVVAGLAWIDTSHTRLALVAGLKEPRSRDLPPGPGYVPLQDRSSLLATFNSGFRTQDGHGGFIANGQVYVRPKEGLGTIAIYRDGSVKVGAWGSEIKPSSQIIYLRQNLPLLVDQGRIDPGVNDRWPWVADTVGNNVLVWRSGIGVDAHGNLIYAAANSITQSGLASLLHRAGAVRAMALDENTYFVDFFTYAAPGGAEPSKLLPSMRNPMDRFLVSDQRDFFMVLK
jgi:Phosphodiester glycosidase